MKRVKSWIVGLTVVALVAVGLVALAGNGFGQGTFNQNQQQTAEPNCDQVGCCGNGNKLSDTEGQAWRWGYSGSGEEECQSYGRRLAGSRPMDGTGFGAQQGKGLHRGTCSGTCAGSCS